MIFWLLFSLLFVEKLPFLAVISHLFGVVKYSTFSSCSMLGGAGNPII